MTTSVKIGETSETLDLVQSVWKAVGAYLENARRRVQEEITHYPPPIPACDADFNHLLEERARISEELNRVRAAAGQSLAATDTVGLIEEFVLSSPCIDDEAKREIGSWLNKSRMKAEG